MATRLYNKYPLNRNVVLDTSGGPGAGLVVLDKSKYRNNGAITGTAWVQLASGEWVLSFDGVDDLVDFGGADSLDSISTEFMIDYWIYINAYPTSGLLSYILEKNNHAASPVGKSWSVALYPDGIGYFFIRKSDDSTYDNIVWSAIPLATWRHMAHVFKGGVILANYQNGEVDGSKVSELTTIASSTYNVKSGEGTFPLNAKLSRIKISNKIATAEQIRAIYQTDKWRFGL